MPKHLVRGIVVVTGIALAVPPPALAQLKPTPVANAEAQTFNIAQLDALLAPIALYPDELLTQILMASTYPLQVVAAARWLEQGDNKKLKGDALVKALEKENWDPSVKSLIPFPQVIAMMNENLEWTQQLGYAVAAQQADVLDSVQRLRRQAEKAGSLKTTEQQKVVVEQDAIVIEPASPETVYVPVYQPANVYGDWPYPSSPPVYLPPPAEYYPAAYAPGYVWGTGLAFAAGAAVVGGLWGWTRPGWGSGNVTVNAARYNSINVNRAQIQSSNWRAAAGGVANRPARPPGGPVGSPARPNQLPTNAIGRSNVQVPAGAVNRAQIGQNRPAGAAGAQRPGAGQLPAGQRPVGAGQLPAGQRPGGGIGAAQRPAAGQQPASVVRGGGARAAQRPAGAFGGMGDGARAGQFGARGAQSRSFPQVGGGVQGRAAGAGFQGRAGGGGARAGGGGGRAGGGGGGGFRGRR